MMSSLEQLTLKLASRDPVFRESLIRSFESVKTAGSPLPYLQKYYDHMIGPRKKWENPETGRKVGFWRMMQIDPSFKEKYTHKAKTWWSNQQKRESKDPGKQKVRGVSDTIESHESSVKDMIRDLESGKQGPKKVREQAKEIQRGVGTLSQKAKRMTKGVKRDRMLFRIDRLKKKLDGLTDLGRRKNAPKLKGRKRSS